MGRKDSNKSSRTSRKRDNDSWGDGWEVTHTRTSNTPGKRCQLIRDPCVMQEMCQPSTLPPATVALHAGLLPIIPPGTELEMSADALPTEAEVRLPRAVCTRRGYNTGSPAEPSREAPAPTPPRCTCYARTACRRR